MIYADTDISGTRTYRLPQALADVAVALFPSMSQADAVFRMARSMTWHDIHTAERIALNGTKAEAIEFARARIEKSAPGIRRTH